MNHTSTADLPLLVDAKLRQPLPASAHGWVQGNIYLKKNAIRRHFDRIDPHWSISEPTLTTIYNNVVVMTATLTICGAARSALGTGIIISTNRDGAELMGFELSRATRMAFKTAASDCLPRCALMFGVGDYLKLIPPTIKDVPALARWFASVEAEKKLAELE